MKKYLNSQHVFFCIFMTFVLVLGLLLARYNPATAYMNTAICVLTMLISNQVIYAFNRANIDYRGGLSELNVPGQNIARNLMLAAAMAQYHFPWSFDLHGFLNQPNLLTSIFFLYAMGSAHQISSIDHQ